MQLERARTLAQNFCTIIDPMCDRVSIAGSIRREKDEVKDIEIVAIPAHRLMKPHGGLFEEDQQPLYSFLDRLCDNPKTEFTRDEQTPRWGDKYRRLRYSHRGWGTAIAIDLFLVLPGSWGPQLAIRTGPSDFSRLLVTRQSQGGAMPDDYQMSGGFLFRSGQAVPCLEEQDFFECLGLPYWKPRVRSEFLIKSHLDRTALKT